MVIFHSYVGLPEGKLHENPPLIMFPAPRARLAVSPMLPGDTDMALQDYEVAIEAAAQWDRSKPQGGMVELCKGGKTHGSKNGKYLTPRSRTT